MAFVVVHYRFFSPYFGCKGTFDHEPGTAAELPLAAPTYYLKDETADPTVLSEEALSERAKAATQRCTLLCSKVQSFVCLLTGSPNMSFPDESLVDVEEWSHLLRDAD
jgi:hypothetical protein